MRYCVLKHSIKLTKIFSYYSIKTKKLHLVFINLYLNVCFCQKYYGKKSSVGRDVCRLRKAYYSARHEAAVQIDEIVGETASEADSSESLERDHVHHHHGGGPGSHDKDDDVIRCICGMYKDEGLMIQCEKCMVSGDRKTLGVSCSRWLKACTSFTNFSWDFTLKSPNEIFQGEWAVSPLWILFIFRYKKINKLGGFQYWWSLSSETTVVVWITRAGKRDDTSWPVICHE